MKRLNPHKPSFSLALLLCAASAFAQNGTVTPATGPVSFRISQEHRSARATMRTFLEAMGNLADDDRNERLEKAVGCLDLSKIPETVRADTGIELAIQLKGIIDRTELVDLESISDATAGITYLFLDHEKGEVAIAPNDRGQWLFTSGTLADIPALSRALENSRRFVDSPDEIGFVSPSLWLRSKFPAPLKKVGFLLEHWQWAMLFVLIAVGILLLRILAYFFNQRILSRVKKRKGWEKLPAADLELGKPLGIVLLAFLWSIGLRFLGLPPTTFAIVLAAVKVMGTLGAMTVALKATNLGTDLWELRAEKTASKFDDLMVPLVRSILKTLIVAVSIIFLATTLNMNLAGVLTGLGLGGLAFALAAQDIVSNLFGSFTLLMDRPFEIGDWVVIEGADGNVEKVGLRTTRVRTFYNSLVTIPNSKITNSMIDNYGARRYRRFKTTLSLTYDTPPDKIEEFCEGVRELVHTHKYTRKDYFHVYLNDFGASSLDVLLYIFFETPDWGRELEARHDFMLDTIRLAERLGVEFAFPTRTVHLLGPEEDTNGDARG